MEGGEGASRDVVWYRGHAYRHDLASPPGRAKDSIVIPYPVAPEHAGLRLDRFLQLRIPRISRTKAQLIIRTCAFRADGTRRKPNDVVRAGDTIFLIRERFEEPETPRDFTVVYEDEALYVLNKPAGLPVHPTATYHRNTVTYLLKQRFGLTSPQICHRLDRETSGVLVCAKTLDDERFLKSQFERRKTEKEYVAIVQGEMTNDRGRVDLPLSPVKEGLHLLMEVRDDGESSRAETHFEVRARRRGHSLVALWPKTGRQHQLRVHLAAIGHPIVGDKLYGPYGEDAFREYIAQGLVVNDELRQRLGHDRQALHAQALTLIHPRTRDPITLHAPLADDLEALWNSYEEG